MVQSAEYIYNKLMSEDLLSLAHSARPDLGTAKFPLVTTGHSLGAGTAALLAILLRYTLRPLIGQYSEYWPLIGHYSQYQHLTGRYS